jgi:phage terminase small subunit
MNIKKANERYKDKTEKVKEYMSFIINQLQETYNEVPDRFIISLDMLANMVDIMDKAYSHIEQEGLTKDNKYFGKQQSSALTTYLNAQNYVAKLIAGFGLTPLSASKIKKGKEEVNAEDFLNNLMS